MENPGNKLTIPTISRIEGETIVELIYDRVAKTTAFAVAKDGKLSIEQRVDTPAGERLAPYSATNNLIRHECVLLPSGIEDHGGTAVLLADIQAFIHRYVDFSPLFERIAAHYVLLSWSFDAFNEIPYLRIRGEYGSGKTRALLTLGSIAYKGFFASGASTVSPIFHTLDRFGGTLILDEADLRFSDKTADLVKILNNGTVKGLPVLRTLQNRDKEFNPAAFTVFGPKIIAMRGTFRDPALESRFLSETMGERPMRPDIPIRLPGSLKVEALSLRNRLLHYRLTNLFSSKDRAIASTEGISPRLNQTAASLLALVDDQSLRTEIEDYLRARHSQVLREQKLSPGVRVVAAVRALFEKTDRDYISIKEVADTVNNGDEAFLEPVSPRDVGRILRMATISIKKSHGTIVVMRPETSQSPKS